MSIECIKKYTGSLITIKKGERFFVVDENEEKYCVEITDGAIGWFPKENFKTI